ncbi:C4-dicarboxylate transporter DctA [bacterium]|nr:C4-dicarboxylate transporter DctA [bacterium]
MKITNPKKLTLYVLLSLVLGIAFGIFFPSAAVNLKVLGDIFIRLIKMVIIPIVFCTISIGIGTMESMKKLSRIGGKAFIYFEIMTTLAMAIGIVVVHFVGPGKNFHISSIENVDISKYTSQVKHETFSDFLIGMVPDNALGALASGDMLPVLVFAILFGLALAQVGSKANQVVSALNQFNKVFFTIVGIIMRLSPIAVFGSMAYTVGKFGVQSILPLAKLAACGYMTMILFVVLVLGSVARFYGFSILKIIKYIKDEIFVVIGTSSSETVLPTLMDKLESAGCSKSAVGLIVPTGYSFNLDGTSIYLAMSVVFIAQVYHVHLTWELLLMVLGIMMLTSKGAAAVPGSGFITLAATLSSLPGQPIPVQGIAILLGIDRFMSEARSVTNLIGNTVATLVISKIEGEYSSSQLLDH